MNLVSLIANQVQSKQDLFSNEGKIMDSLMSSGYRLQEADTALALMQSLSQGQDENNENEERAKTVTAMRAMSTQERQRFTVEAFGFVTKLAHLGIIDEEQREEVIEKALSLHARKIDLSDVKTIIALSLFADAREYEDLLVTAMDRSGASWN